MTPLRSPKIGHNFLYWGYLDENKEGQNRDWTEEVSNRCDEAELSEYCEWNCVLKFLLELTLYRKDEFYEYVETWRGVESEFEG